MKSLPPIFAGRARHLRPGRMPRAQRWLTWFVVGCCLVSGLAYLAAMDFVDAGAGPLKFWWIAHGVSSFVALPAIGAALAMHVRAAWRARRGVATGLSNLVALALLAVTAVALFYGLPAWHDAARSIHAIVGVAAFVLFPLHVLWGRTRAGRADRDPADRDDATD